MKGEILFLCHRIPFPPDRGDKIRSHHILKRLTEIAPVHVGCFADDDRDMGFAPEMAAMAVSQKVLKRNRSKVVAGLTGLAKGQPLLVSLFENAELHDWVAQILAKRPIVAIFAYSAQMAHFVPLGLSDKIRFMMDFVDLDSAKYATYGAEGRGPMAWINRREGRVLLKFEREVAQRANICSFVSEAEAALFRAEIENGQDNIIALENGVAVDFFDPNAQFEPIEKENGPLIVFTGQMDYRPNIEAVESFVRDVFPAILIKHPDTRFAIVGRNPTAQVEALAHHPSVIVTGAVPDVRGWLAAADVVVAPLRIARGIQNKVLEAMAMARPVVASDQAAEGIDATDGEHFIVTCNVHDEAQAVVDLLDDKERAEKMGRFARARVQERYQWSATLSMLPELLSGALPKSAPTQ